jgi:hypothetical protein
MLQFSSCIDKLRLCLRNFFHVALLYFFTFSSQELQLVREQSYCLTFAQDARDFVHVSRALPKASTDAGDRFLRERICDLSRLPIR